MSTTRRIKLELLPGTPIPAVGEAFAGGVVVASFPEIGDRNIIVETATDLGAFLPLAADYRPEHTDYGPVAVCDAPRPLTVGDTYPLEAIRARGQFGAGVRLGIVDTGLDKAHIAFDGCTVDTDTGDSHGHGTHVASTAASQWGIASKAHIIARAGIPGGNGTESSVANAMRAVTDAGAQIVSLSLGGSVSSVIDAACEYARSRGAIVVAAAGNSAGAAIGSPARASDVIVMACDRARNYASFTSGTTWSNPNRVTEYGVDIWAAQAGTRDVARAMSGTSMACPGVSGKLALLLASGLPRAEALHYLFTHRSSPPQVGVSVFGTDFGEEAPPVDGETQRLLDSLRGTAAAIRGNFDYARYTLRNTNPDAAWTHVGEGARLFEQDFEPVLGALEAHLKADPGPEPGPTPTRIRAVAGTYSGHGLALDAYPGVTEEQVQWGPHHGYGLVAPCDGRVEVYQFGTPLDTRNISPQWHDLFDGWTCRTFHPMQTMYVAVFWPDEELVIEGQRIGHLHYGHVRSDVRTGPVRKGEWFAAVWDSGIRWEPRLDTRAAHVHACAGSGTQLSPNGDLPGRLALVAQGWDVTTLTSVPGPQDYHTGAWCAGRPRVEFERAGRPLPPIPA